MRGTGAAAGAARRDPYWPAVALLWLLACAVLLVMRRHGIAEFDFPDVDDQLRLVEVRDWLGGQGFRDVSQHRMNPPDGAPMHWSRLVDIPIAAMIVALRPLIGVARAELAAVVEVPLVTLGVAMTFTGLIARRLAGPGAGLLATAFAPTAFAAALQMQPMRIDHHGWEIALSLVALHAALRPDGGRGGAIAGAVVAIAMQISLEVLPFAVALGGVLGAHWILIPQAAARRRLAAYVVSLAAVEAALYLIFHGADPRVFCDAVSPPHLIGLGLAAAGVAAATHLDPQRAIARAGALAAVAALAALAFHAVPPGCGTDAFATLEPIVRTYWYQKVDEGLPVWRVDGVAAVSAIGFPFVALPCALMAWRKTRAAAWGVTMAMLLAATVVGVMVLRAGALANLLAVPPVAWAALTLLRRARGHDSAVVRVLGSVAVLVALSPWAPAVLAAAVLPEVKSIDPVEAHPCNAIDSIRALRALPPSRVFAPLDYGPALLLETPHQVLASGHHRNHVAMAEEIRAWIGDEAVARAVLRRHGMDYVVACRTYAETDSYARAAPHGLAARLKAGRPPAWLAPVRVPGTRLGVWRVAP